MDCLPGVTDCKHLAISHQPSAISHQPSGISHQPSAISHSRSVAIPVAWPTAKAEC
ncbi:MULTISPECIES: hypothetical protein [Moorena]|uniref:hypothetical protein n=1 Tax=Moorena TaxID=1155738 RepID=UPI00142A782D|nr:hypothetical protein [Moorena sp. SIO4G3]NEO79251.1 hypothetical protein [Moorena sp. SIO4G3]